MLKPSLNRRRITAFTLSVATACALAAPVVASPTANIPSGTFTSALQLANGTQATNARPLASNPVCAFGIQRW